MEIYGISSIHNSWCTKISKLFCWGCKASHPCACSKPFRKDVGGGSCFWVVREKSAKTCKDVQRMAQAANPINRSINSIGQSINRSQWIDRFNIRFIFWWTNIIYIYYIRQFHTISINIIKDKISFIFSLLQYIFQYNITIYIYIYTL